MLKQSTRPGLASAYAAMWVAPGIALAAGILLAVWQPAHLSLALPLLGLWFAAPGIAWWISRPIVAATPKLTAAQTTLPAPHRPPDLALF